MTSGAPRAISIVVPFDFSADSELALRHALALVGPAGGTVSVLSVGAASGDDIRLEVPDKVSTMSQRGAVGLLKVNVARALGGDSDVEGSHVTLDYQVRRGAYGAEIVKFAADVDADAIVMGTHGRRGVQRALLGSVAEYVVRHAGCSVTVVRPKAHGAAAG